jgi:hypothetical protein
MGMHGAVRDIARLRRERAVIRPPTRASVNYGCAVERPLREGMRHAQRKTAIVVGIVYALAALALYFALVP